MVVGLLCAKALTHEHKHEPMTLLCVNIRGVKGAKRLLIRVSGV